MHEPPAPGPEATHEDVAYEKTDLSLRGVILFGLALGLLAVVAHFGLAWLFDAFRREERAKQPTQSPLATERVRLPKELNRIPPPRLEKSETANLQEVRQYEDALLNNYEWVDRKAGIVRIPIAEAMRLLADPKIAEAHGIREKNDNWHGERGPEMMIRKLAIGLGSLWLVAGWSGAQSETPAPDIGLDQRLDDPVPLDLMFRDEQGRAVALRQFMDGKPVILVLAYYRCPRLCSLVLNGLVESLQRVDYDIGKEFNVMTVSIDPRETPELAAAKKAAYIEHYGRSGADQGWHFLTGDDSAIKQLAAAVGFRYAYDARRDQYDHAAGIMIVTPEGKIARYFYGVSFSPRDLRFGLEDAAAGNIGSAVARPLRLLCFAYDPMTGKYTFMTMRLVQAGGILTVLLFGVFLLRAWRRERRQAKLVATGGK